MPGARLFTSLALKLACVAGFVVLALHDHPGWGCALLPLFVFTRVPKY